MDSWEAIKEICKDSFSVDPKVLDYIAVRDILELCARGKSNKVIEVVTGFDGQYIEDTLKEFYNFGGFDYNIKVDTRVIYDRHRYNKYRFISSIRTADNTDEELLKLLYHANVLLDELERSIEDYYGKS